MPEDEPDLTNDEAADFALWRKLRNEARALALRLTDAQARDTLMRIAIEYNRLARRAEDITARRQTRKE
jgi:hypothetical protein